MSDNLTIEKPQKHTVKSKADKPVIPSDILLHFLENSMKLKDVSNVVQIKDEFLWGLGDYERHRVNVYIREYIDGDFCHRNLIGEYSWFLHYNRQENTIQDKTVGRVVDDSPNKNKKLQGIANGSERIGKSFR